jgi:SAM-dependent methyltransferase
MTETFQLSIDQAQAYEDLFVPALFAQWAPQLVACAGVESGQRVLDVGCGTGIVARAAAEAVGPNGRVTGLDLNPAMLEIAGRVRPDIDWREGDAAELPFEDGSSDAVLCQSALFFFPDRAAAVREMARVVRRHGSVALQTYADLRDQPGYRPFVDVVARHVGDEARSLLGTYWSCGELTTLTDLLLGAGLEVVKTRTRLGSVTFPSVDAVVHTEVQATPLASRITESEYLGIIEDTRAALARFIAPSGLVELPIRALFACGRKPSLAPR